MPVNARQKITKVFHIDIESEIDDTRYQGTFTCKKLSIQDRTKMGVVKAQLNGGMHYDPEKPGLGLDPDTDAFNAVLAHITVALVEVPDFWDLDNMSDLTVIYEVYREVAEHEASFRGGRKAKRQEPRSASESNRSEEDRLSNEPGAVSQVVDPEVQTALEP